MSNVRITRAPGPGVSVTVTLKVDASDPDQLDRLGRAIALVLEPEDRQELEDNLTAEVKALGILAGLPPV